MSPPPLSLWHCDPELCSIEKRFNWKEAHFMGRPTPLKSNGANFSTLLPPRGATFTPFWWYGLQSLPASSNVANFHISVNPLSELRGVKSFSQCKAMGQLWDAPATQGCQTLPHFEVMVLQSLPASWNVANFTFLWNPLSEYEASKFFSMLSLCGFFFAPICPWGKHRTPDRL